MKKSCIFTTFVIVFIAAFFVVDAFASPGDNLNCRNWTLKSESKVENNPSLIHSVWEVYRPPYGVLDRIALHRVVNKDRPPGGGKDKNKVIFMIPGTWGTGGWSEITDPDLNTMLYLANNDYDVYTMDFRSSNITDVSYLQFFDLEIDISPTTDWTYGVFREDIESCARKIKDLSGAKKMFMSGFSRGGVLIFIYARKYANDVRGLVVLDSYIKDMPPFIPPLDEATYNQVIALWKARLLIDPDTQEETPWITGVFFQDRKDHVNWKMAGALPFATTLAGEPLPEEFDVISDYVADSAHYVWGPVFGEGSLTNYHGGYIDRDVLVKILNEFTPYYPVLQILEDQQLYAYTDVPYFDYDDGDVYLPAIAFLSPQVGCPGNICLIDAIPNMTKSDDVTINLLQGYGHMDVLFGKYSVNDVKKPLVTWLDQHLD